MKIHDSQFLKEVKVGKEKKKDKTVMFCECCGEPYKRWDIDMVEPCEIAFKEFYEVHQDFGYVFNFACPDCKWELCLTPVQSEEADKFRLTNEKLRSVLEPQILN